MKDHFSFGLLAIGTLFIVALAAPAQQTATGPGAEGKGDRVQGAAQDDVPNVEQMIIELTVKLDLDVDQRARITPILRGLHNIQQKLAQDKNLSREERLARVRPHRYEANKQIRDILSDDQKKKFDQYLLGPHPEMHGNLSGATPPH